MRKRIATALAGLAAAAALALAAAAPASADEALNTWPGAGVHGDIDLDGGQVDNVPSCC